MPPKVEQVGFIVHATLFHVLTFKAEQEWTAWAGRTLD